MQISSRFFWNCIRFVFTVLFLFIVWIVFSAEFSSFWLAFGFIVSLLTAVYTYTVFIQSNEAARNAVLPRPIRLVWTYIYLIVSMYVSSLKVFRSVFTGGINPGVVYIKTRLLSDIGRTALANAITFTPGTVTLNLDEDHITVHWLFVSTRHSKAAGDEMKGKMEIFLKQVWL